LSWNKIVGTGSSKSAYQTWVDLGNTGTEQDFINSLKGATGPQGPVGPSGNVAGFSFKGNKTVADFKEVTESGMWFVTCTDKTKYPYDTGNTTPNVYLDVKTYLVAGTLHYMEYKLQDKDQKKEFLGTRYNEAANIVWKQVIYKEEQLQRDTNVLFFGDSITANPYGRPTILEKRTGAKFAFSAWGGSAIAKRGENWDIQTPVRPNYWDDKSLVERVKVGATNGFYYGAGTANGFVENTSMDFSLFSNFVIFMGTNDAPLNGFGTIDAGDSNGNYDEFTLYGALNKTIKTIYSRKTDANIMFVTPAYRKTQMENVNAIKDAIINICKKYNLPYLPLSEVGGINQHNVDAMLWDGLHPTTEGSSQLMDKIGEFIYQNMRSKGYTTFRQ
jgi:lysophospholipase L1-like esterase